MAACTMAAKNPERDLIFMSRALAISKSRSSCCNLPSLTFFSDDLPFPAFEEALEVDEEDEEEEEEDEEESDE